MPLLDRSTKRAGRVVRRGESQAVMAERILLRETAADGVIELRQCGRVRSLWLDDGLLQSEIDLDRPDHLPNPASRAMLAHLLFYPEPRRVLLAGCGGGGIARWFHARSPDTAGLAVELSPRVAEVARSHFDFPGVGSGWELRTGDVRDGALLQGEEAFDFILVDIAEAGHTPAWVSGAPFLDACRGLLSSTGVLTVNLIPEDADDFAGALYRLRRVFDHRSVCMTVPERGNVMLLGFMSRPDLERVKERMLAKQIRWGLEFDAFWQRMTRENPVGSGVF